MELANEFNALIQGIQGHACNAEMAADGDKEHIIDGSDFKIKDDNGNIAETGEASEDSAASKAQLDHKPMRTKVSSAEKRAREYQQWAFALPSLIPIYLEWLHQRFIEGPVKFCHTLYVLTINTIYIFDKISIRGLLDYILSARLY